MSVRLHLFLCVSSAFAAIADTSAIEVQFDAKSGSYDILVDGSSWFPSSDPSLFSDWSAASLKLSSTASHKGEDALFGSFVDYTQEWLANGKLPIMHTIRHFVGYDAVEFTTVFPEGVNGSSAGDIDAVSAAFTAFRLPTPSPTDSEKLGYATWSGNMMADKYTTFGKYDDQAQGIQGGIKGGLMTVFDNQARNSVVVSASSNFMAASFYRASNDTLRLGVMGGVTSIPVGYSMSFVICASRSGPNNAFSRWGQFLLRKHGKDSAMRDSDFVLNYLGYSTDNGAYYYYHVENATGRWKEPEDFEKTQMDLKAYADEEAIPYRYILLDSWWYPKDENLAVTTWTALPEVYPHGLHNIWEKTGWKVQGHNRYWSPKTPYAKQNGGSYNFIVEAESGKAIPVDQQFWDDLMANSTRWGLTMYEQDWLHNEFEGLNATLSSATLAREWLLQMGRGASKNGVTIQYCMPYARHVLQSVEVPAVTNFRASDDYQPGNDQWKLGLSSIIADALALAPSKDDFWSTQVQPGNDYNAQEPNFELESAIITFTAGPVAPSDMIGGSNAELIKRSCNSDGLLLKASLPAKSIDATFAYRAFGTAGPDGEVYSSYSDFGALRFHHVISANLKNAPYKLGPSELGASDQVRMRAFIHSPRNSSHPARVLKGMFTDENPIILDRCGTLDFQVFHTVPVLPSSSWTILGELSKWVPMSPQRVTDISTTATGFSISLRGAAREAVEMWFADSDDRLVKVDCQLSDAGSAIVSMPDARCSFQSQAMQEMII
jgi:hypothetical protein